MSLSYGFDDSFDEYSFPAARKPYDEYKMGENSERAARKPFDEYEQMDEYNCYVGDDYLDMSDACSSSDCTGLIKSGTATEDELDDYTDIYRFGQPKNKKI